MREYDWWMWNYIIFLEMTNLKFKKFEFQENWIWGWAFLFFNVNQSLRVSLFFFIWKIHFLLLLQCIPYLKWLLNNAFSFPSIFWWISGITTLKHLSRYLSVACSGPSQTCKVKFFAKIVHDFQMSTIFAKSSIIFVSLGSEYAHGNYNKVSKKKYL